MQNKKEKILEIIMQLHNILKISDKDIKSYTFKMLCKMLNHHLKTINKELTITNTE